VLTALCHSDETGWVKVEDLTKVSDLRAEEGSLVWGEADISEFGKSDLATISEEFELDPMAVEDAVNPRQRPKIERYDKHRFAVLHELYEIDDQLEKRQISCFVGKDFMLVIHEGAHHLLERVRKRVEASKHDVRGPIALLYALLDVVVDEYQELADKLEDSVEKTEDQVVTAARARAGNGGGRSNQLKKDEATQVQLYSIKQQVARLRRYALPLERVVKQFLDGELAGELGASAHRLFRDIHDHTLRIAEQVHNIDDLSQAVLDLARAEQSEDLNEINKRLSGWAAIVAVPTVIAGIYGMNYRLFPAAHVFGFWFALILMVMSSGGLYAYFRNKRWL
jgi:magnesium transporter